MVPQGYYRRLALRVENLRNLCSSLAVVRGHWLEAEDEDRAADLVILTIVSAS
jgi:hypothetical protein